MQHSTTGNDNTPQWKPNHFTSVEYNNRREKLRKTKKNKNKCNIPRRGMTIPRSGKPVSTSVAQPTWKDLGYNDRRLNVGWGTDVETPSQPTWNCFFVLVLVWYSLIRIYVQSLYVIHHLFVQVICKKCVNFHWHLYMTKDFRGKEK
jgi:hypothetical protein